MTWSTDISLIAISCKLTNACFDLRYSYLYPMYQSHRNNGFVDTGCHPFSAVGDKLITHINPVPVILTKAVDSCKTHPCRWWITCFTSTYLIVNSGTSNRFCNLYYCHLFLLIKQTFCLYSCY